MAMAFNRMGSRGLFHNINEDALLLLLKVSFQINHAYILPLKFYTSFALVSILHPVDFSPALVCHILLVSASEVLNIPHNLDRKTHMEGQLELRSITVVLLLRKLCKCLFLDRASSLAFENIMPDL
jgi:hypothetical protein